MKKIELHIDALIVIIILFILSFGFGFYQHHQYSSLLAEHNRLQTTHLGMELSLSVKEALLKKCQEQPASVSPQVN